MKWGIRKDRKTGSGNKKSGGKKQLTPEQRELRRKRLKKVAIGAALVGTAVGLHVAQKHLHKKNMDAFGKAHEGFKSYEKQLSGMKPNKAAVDKYASAARALRKAVPNVSKSAVNRLRRNHSNISDRALTEYTKAIKNPFAVNRFNPGGIGYADSRDPLRRSITPTWDDYTSNPKVGRAVRRTIKSARMKRR